MEQRDMGDLLLHMYYAAHEDYTNGLRTQSDPEIAKRYRGYIPELIEKIEERRFRVEAIHSVAYQELEGYSTKQKDELQQLMMQASDQQRESELFPDDMERRQALFTAKDAVNQYRASLPKRRSRKH